MPRPRKKKENIYFDEPELSVNFFSSGCTLLDLVLGGGWAESRMINIVGDKSTGKTLIAIEAFINFNLKYPNSWLRYHEAEAAFDTRYATRIGLPVDRMDFVSEPGSRIDTAEGLFYELNDTINKAKTPTLYILDSLDALTDEAEKKKNIEDQDYDRKAAKMSELFRKLAARLADSQVCFIIISQIRDNVGVKFGKKTKRSGGRAMDFYASQVTWLADLGAVRRKIKGVERVYGRKIRILCEKNKVSDAWRECNFNIINQFGMDDIWANLVWLNSINEYKLLKSLGLNLFEKNKKGKLVVVEDKERVKKITKYARKMNVESDKVFKEELSGNVKRLWLDIEEKFKYPKGKYD